MYALVTQEDPLGLSNPRGSPMYVLVTQEDSSTYA